MTFEIHEDKADRIISTLAWLDGLPPHRRASLKDMIAAGIMEAVHELERSLVNQVSGLVDEKIKLELQIEEQQNKINRLKRVLYEECMGTPCSPDCGGGHYRDCVGCDRRAKMAHGEGWGK